MSYGKPWFSATLENDSLFTGGLLGDSSLMFQALYVRPFSCGRAETKIKG